MIEETDLLGSDIDALMQGNEDAPMDHPTNPNLLSTQAKTISNARNVPKKSISLARLEMGELDNSDGVQNSVESQGRYERNHTWPEALQHWWFRMGRSITLYRGTVKDKPVSSAIRTQEKLYTHNTEDKEDIPPDVRPGENLSNSLKQVYDPSSVAKKPKVTPRRK